MTLINYLQWMDGIYPDYNLPPNIDRDTLNASIVIRCGATKLVWDTPNDFTWACKNWFAQNYNAFNALANTLSLEYNPLANRDMVFTQVDKSTRDSSGDGENTTTGDRENKVSAYNADIYSPSSQTDDSSNGTSHYEAKDEQDFTRDTHDVGMTGAHTYQQLIREQRDVVDYNIYDVIASRFEHAMCIMVY